MAQASRSELPYVLSFVGENENGILGWWTKQVLNALSVYGLAYRIIDIKPGWRSELSECLSGRKPLFCFSFQGFGMNLVSNGVNYWSQEQIPFISCMGDSPYHAPALHRAEGPGLYFLYGCADFLDVYRHAMKGKACAGLIRYGFPDNPHADDTAWAEREHSVVYCKTAIDPRLLAAAWEEYPQSVRVLLRESTDFVLTGTNATVADVCAAVFEQHAQHCGDQTELFLFVCSTVDRYVRAIRAERMVRALLAHDALIIGNWSHLDTTHARARVCMPIPADQLDRLYAASRISVNTLPSVRHGLHERVAAALFAKTALVSDSTPFLDGILADCPSYVGLEIDSVTFAEQLGSALQATLDDSAMADKVAQSAAVARSRFPLENFASTVMEQFHVEMHRRSIEGWWGSQPEVRRGNGAALAA